MIITNITAKRVIAIVGNFKYAASIKPIKKKGDIFLLIIIFNSMANPIAGNKFAAADKPLITSTGIDLTKV